MDKKLYLKELKIKNKELEKEIAECKKSVLTLKKNDEDNKFLLDAINEGWCIINRDWTISKINRAAVDFINLSTEDIISFDISVSLSS